MTFLDIELPSNRKFGFFFTFVFALAAAYFYNSTAAIWAYTFATVSSIFLMITVAKADIFLPLNKLWMRFGHLLGKIVSPIVMGIIFFGIFTPIAIFMRLAGRDELRLKFRKKPSHWMSHSELIKSESFEKQF